MESQVLVGQQPKSDEEYKREIDRMAVEVLAMLDDSARRLEHARRLRGENRNALAELEKRLSCGNA